MKNKKESFLKGIFVLLLSQLFIKTIGMVYKLYLTNKNGFGDIGNAIYSSGFQIYALLLTFSSTGVPNAISKLVSEKIALRDYKGANKIFKIALFTFAFIGTVGSIGLFLGAKIIANKWMQIPEAEYSLIALSPSIFFVSIVAVIRGYFNGIQSFSLTAKSQSMEQIFKTVFTIILVEVAIFIGRKNVSIMAAAANLATTIATIGSLIYIYLCYRKKKKEISNSIIKFSNNKQTRIRKTIKDILNVAFPISLSSLIASFNKNIDSFTIVRFLKKIITEKEAKTQYGMLSGKVDTLCALPFSINVALVTTLVPSVSRSMAIKDLNEVNKKTKLFILVTILIALPITSLMFIYANEIIQILFPNAKDGWMYLRWNSIGIIFMLLAQTTNAILQGIGKVNVPAMSFSIGMCLKLILNIMLIPIKQIGIFGAIIGNIVCNLVAFVISFIVLKKHLKLKLEWDIFLIKPLFATMCMSIVSILIYSKLGCINLKNVAIILALGISMLIYILVIFALKVFSKEDLTLLMEKSLKK